MNKLFPKAILKQKGKPSKARLEIERDKDFKELNNAHQSVESNIKTYTNVDTRGKKTLRNTFL
ncbi:MAG: hypothetical protein HRT67_01870 [Flavobacteriaceae bacterium]|nr:hypothetical protein [Flavobacteriaceae bacterium]